MGAGSAGSATARKRVHNHLPSSSSSSPDSKHRSGEDEKARSQRQPRSTREMGGDELS